MRGEGAAVGRGRASQSTCRRQAAAAAVPKVAGQRVPQRSDLPGAMTGVLRHSSPPRGDSGGGVARTFPSAQSFAPPRSPRGHGRFPDRGRAGRGAKRRPKRLLAWRRQVLWLCSDSVVARSFAWSLALRARAESGERGRCFHRPCTGSYPTSWLLMPLTELLCGPKRGAEQKRSGNLCHSEQAKVFTFKGNVSTNQNPSQAAPTAKADRSATAATARPN